MTNLTVYQLDLYKFLLACESVDIDELLTHFPHYKEDELIRLLRQLMIKGYVKMSINNYYRAVRGINV